MKCPKCGSEKVHETNLHECPSGGVPMRCSDCCHTWCEGENDGVAKCSRIMKIPPKKRGESDHGLCLGVLSEALPDAPEQDKIIFCSGDWDKLDEGKKCEPYFSFSCTSHEAELIGVNLIRAASFAQILEGKIGDLKIEKKKEECK